MVQCVGRLGPSVRGRRHYVGDDVREDRNSEMPDTFVSVVAGILKGQIKRGFWRVLLV